MVSVFAMKEVFPFSNSLGVEDAILVVISQATPASLAQMHVLIAWMLTTVYNVSPISK